MIIAGIDLPCIGLIKAKRLPSGRYELEVHPQTPGPLAGADGATMMEIEVDVEEVRRIARVAPHLLSQPMFGGKPEWEE
jgi:hypothetical protein